MPDSRASPRERQRGRGQSELVGFLIIFSVAITVIIVVLATGFTGLDAAQDYQRTANAEQGFTALAQEIHDVVYHGAPSRATEIRLADARLSVADSESITVRNDTGTQLAQVDLHPIVYESGTGTTLTYYSGALVRADDGSPVMLRDPNILLTDEELVVPIVQTVPAGGAVVGGRTDAEVQSRQAGTNRTVSNKTLSGGNVTLNVSTSHVAAWERYFEGFENATIEATGDSYVETRIQADRLYVIEKRVRISVQ